MRLEMCDRRRETGDLRQETYSKIGEVRQETWDRIMRRETGNVRQET